MSELTEMNKGAILSTCRTYRYVLFREWDPSLGNAMFVGLNPSTADETDDDATIRRCIRYAKDWGYGGLWMLNIFGFRSRYPKVMMAAEDPIGPLNDHYLKTHAAAAKIVVAAWGVHGYLKNRGNVVREMLPNMHCLVLTKDGQPGHPLFLEADLKPFPLEKARGSI